MRLALAMLRRRAIMFLLGVAFGCALSFTWHFFAPKLSNGASFGAVASAATTRATTTTKNWPETTVATAKTVRILCLILTHPSNYVTKALPVNATWARKCDRHYFIGSGKTLLKIPLISLNITEKRQMLWRKSWMAFEAASKVAGFDNFDFVLKADDDTFVVMENLRLLLHRFDPKQPTLTGRIFKLTGDVKRLYASGGAGYVLSRAAANLLVSKGLRNSECRQHSNRPEDFLMGSCLQKLGVMLIDSRDQQKLETFHPLTPRDMIGQPTQTMPAWMKQYNYHPFAACMNCTSTRSVTYHYVHNMYEIEYLLYHVRTE